MSDNFAEVHILPSNSPTIASQEALSSNMASEFGKVAVDIDLLEKEILAKETTRQYPDLSGDISGGSRRNNVEPNLETDFDTLNEPVWATMKRDLNAVCAKFAQVFRPRNNDKLLRDWDLWGPLFICVFMSLILQGGEVDKGPHFTEVFVLTFFGSCTVTLNTKLLGGKISFFQTLCVLGYCLFPLAVAALFSRIIFIIVERSVFTGLLILVTSVFGFSWAIYASMTFLSGLNLPGRKLLAMYPVILFYFVISWLVVSRSVFTR